VPVTTTAAPPMSSPSRDPRQRQQHPRSGRAHRLALAALPLLLLVACGGGGDDAEPVTPPPVVPVTGYTVGGTVAGLGEGRNLVLQVQGADDLTVAANGTFVMGRRFERSGIAVVTVASHPEGQRCNVAQPTQVVNEANITNVSVRCETLPAGTRNLSGVVTGLVPRSPLVLQNNQRDDLTVKADGRFFFNTAVASGATYAVQVQTQPVGQTCSVANASGTVGSSDVRSVQVTCTGLPQAAPDGAWASEYCSSGFDVSTREYLNIVRDGDLRAITTQGSVTRWGLFCSPGSEALTGRPAVRVEFDRQETRGSLTAFWGTQTSSAGTKRVVWARKGPYLCLLPRKTFDQPDPVKEYPTIASVEQDTDESIQAKVCYLKSPN
jgi:hypothetical protein